MSLADRMTCRQNANGTYTVRVTRRFVTQFGLGYLDETFTYVAETPPSSPGAAWREGQRRTRQQRKDRSEERTFHRDRAGLSG